MTPSSPASPPASCRLIEQDIARHFDFEERELFTRLTESGEGDIADLLT